MTSPRQKKITKILRKKEIMAALIVDKTPTKKVQPEKTVVSPEVVSPAVVSPAVVSHKE